MVARMTTVFSFQGTSSSTISRTDTGQKNALRTQIMDRLAAADPDKAAKAEEDLSAMEQAIRQMQQMRSDQKAARKQAAKQKIARIKAQIQALKLAGGDAEANARKLARLARELASAVRSYKAGGQGEGGGISSVAAVQGADASSPSAAQAVSSVDAASIAADDEGMDFPADVSGGQAAYTAAGQAGAETAAGQNDDDSSDEEDAEFAKEARKLKREIKALLEKQKQRMAAEGGAETQDMHRADAALRDVERQLSWLEMPAVSVNIEV